MFFPLVQIRHLDGKWDVEVLAQLSGQPFHAVAPCCCTNLYPALLDLQPVGGCYHPLSFLGPSADVIQDWGFWTPPQ